MEEGQKYTGIEHQSILVFLYFPHFICCQCVSVFLSNAAQTHNFLFINHWFILPIWCICTNKRAHFSMERGKKPREIDREREKWIVVLHLIYSSLHTITKPAGYRRKSLPIGSPKERKLLANELNRNGEMVHNLWNANKSFFVREREQMCECLLLVYLMENSLLPENILSGCK